MMNSGLRVAPSATPPSSTSSLHLHHKSLQLCPSILTSANCPPHQQVSFSSSWSQPATARPRLPRLCRNSSPGSPGSGETDNRTVLDAFFLGKALGEALTERIESAVGEVLSTVGRFQAEQQKQIQEFQEDVLERAKRAKEKAAREALQEQGRLIPPSSISNEPVTNGSSSIASPRSVGSATPAAPASVDNQNSPPSSRDEDRTGYITGIQVDD
uniref:Uncharacterized protein n=1 Tax=Opuntia streptacantha TaxID=393608 RepID=A0A7C8YV78_OPUST